MSANARKAEAAVYWVLDTMAEGGGVIDTRCLADSLLGYLAQQWDTMSQDDHALLAGAVAALSLAGDKLGPIARMDDDAVAQAVQRGADVELLPVGGLIHERQ